jgi:hypothetical protein
MSPTFTRCDAISEVDGVLFRCSYEQHADRNKAAVARYGIDSFYRDNPPEPMDDLSLIAYHKSLLIQSFYDEPFIKSLI